MYQVCLELFGVQSQVVWTPSSFDSLPSIDYQYGTKVLRVFLQCSNGSDSLALLGEKYTNTYFMQLSSKCACYDGCKTTPTTTSTKVITSLSPSSPAPITHSCFYTDSQRGTINITSIGNIYHYPAFKDYQSTTFSNYRWSYNPCFSFNEYNCTNAAACQINPVSLSGSVIAEQQTAEWYNTDTDHPVILYTTHKGMSTQKMLVVELECNNDVNAPHQLEVIGQTSPTVYKMKLNSHCA
ncbi:unnamed protein product [Didymodactylos carnosus]|uniref:Uncharacterized protein n=1 Tax=Didymodactylos carnosus TaxID=1234261 RepID=A0A815B535_9BILA|nr:unnamed protein product [Didymodactylos carnosus]CAF4047769.1 unnamed protein product [Didymodactylos carnosus]